MGCELNSAGCSNFREQSGSRFPSRPAVAIPVVVAGTVAADVETVAEAAAIAEQTEVPSAVRIAAVPSASELSGRMCIRLARLRR